MKSNHRPLGDEPVKWDSVTGGGNRKKKKKTKPPGEGHQSFADKLKMRRFRLHSKARPTTSSMSDSLSEASSQPSALRTHSNASTGIYRNSSINSYQSGKSGRSTRSTGTTLTALSSLNGSHSGASSKSGQRSRRNSRFEDEFSEGQLGINDKELNSMNKHIPALKSHGKSATFRQHYYPEGSWGWVITLCCFIVNMFTYGLQFSFSILQIEIVRHCEASQPAPNHDRIRQNAVWIGSCNLAMSHFLAPILVAFCRRKSTRLTAVVGGLIMALALLFASFARYFHQIFLSYGILFAIGNAMVRETSTLMLSQYFKRKRELVEVISSIGTGVGVVVFTKGFSLGIGSLEWRLGLQLVTGCLTSLFFLGLFYRSASLYHPQRRAILHLKDMSKRKGKDKSKIDNKPPYFDFASLRCQPFQIILVSTVLATLGAYTPLFYMVQLSLDEGLALESVIQLQIFLGIAMSCGSVLFGLIVLSRSQQCLISRQYLLQSSIFGIAISLLAFTSVEGYHGYLLFVWLYGVFLGGFHLCQSVYTLERVHMRHFPRAWGFVQGVKAIPLLVGIPIVGYINRGLDMPKGGYFFSFACVFAGAMSLFLVNCFSQSKGNKEHQPFCPDGALPGPDSAAIAPEQFILQEAVSDGILLGRGASVVANMSGPPTLAGLGCTCDHGWAAPPASIPELEQALRRLSFGHIYDKCVSETDLKRLQQANGGDAEPRKSSFNSVVPLHEGNFPEEDEADEDEVLLADDLAKPELLTCISEENLFENLDVDYFGECISPAHTAQGPSDDVERNLIRDFELPPNPEGSPVKLLTGLLGSLSEPDLRASFVLEPDTGPPVPLARIAAGIREMAKRRSRITEAEEEEQCCSATPTNSAILSRQKTWHFFSSKASSAHGRKNDPVKGTFKPTSSTLFRASRAQPAGDDNLISQCGTTPPTNTRGSQRKVLKTSLTPTVISEVTSFV